MEVWIQPPTIDRFYGDEPLIKAFEDTAEEQKFLTSTLHQIQQEQGGLAATCVVARTNSGVEKLNVAMKRAGFTTRIINKDESDDPSDPALRIATMHRVKGLEFDQVFIPNLDINQLPLRVELDQRPDQLSRELFENQERSLLHVAATRAKKRVVITYSGKPSIFISKQ